MGLDRSGWLNLDLSPLLIQRHADEAWDLGRRLLEGAELEVFEDQQESYFTVLRDAMDIDSLGTPALYFGTTTGQLWMGRDGGESWSCVFDSLPPINCVKVAVA